MSLKTYNWAATGAHFALGTFFTIFFPIINSKYPQNQNAKNLLALQDHHLTFSSGQVPVLGWKSEPSIKTSLTTAQVLVVVFYYVTAIFHLIYASSSIYPLLIKKRNNWLRWIEYSITSTIMINIIALMCTVKDTSTFILLNSCNIVMISLGQMVEEKIRAGESPLVPMITSFFLLFSEFAVITREYLIHVGQIKDYIKTNPSIKPIPSWIPYMLIVLFLFFTSFGCVSIYQAMHPDDDYEFIEKIYIILSLVAKTTLGVFMAYGAAGGQQRF
jgi:hypothetical protein